MHAAQLLSTAWAAARSTGSTCQSQHKRHMPNGDKPRNTADLTTTRIQAEEWHSDLCRYKLPVAQLRARAQPSLHMRMLATRTAPTN